MKIFLLTLIVCFASLFCAAQNASSTARQTIVFRLADISILEKKALIPSESGTENKKQLLIQSNGQWIITTKTDSIFSNTKEENDYFSITNGEPSNIGTVYTLSKS